MLPGEPGKSTFQISCPRNAGKSRETGRDGVGITIVHLRGKELWNSMHRIMSVLGEENPHEINLYYTAE